MDDLAKLAFEACQKFLAENVPDDHPDLSESWETLPRVYRDAWDAGVQAVLAVVNG